jgi:membrane protease subunit HflK
MADDEAPTDGVESADTEAPRRAASARFDVAESNAVDFRDALDPATHSLGEALKLSYRILQVGILALVVMFLFSGFQQVSEGFTGVKTLFGAIAGKEGEEQLQSGLQPYWPYPIGDLVVFDQKHSLVLDRAFMPAPRSQGDLTQKTADQQIDTAESSAGLKPGMDGSLLTRDGDLAHALFEVEYLVVDAVKFLETTSPAKADELVTAILKQAAVEAASTLTLAEFTETRDALGPAVRERAQRSLDKLETGIELSVVRANARSAPYAVQNRFREVQTAREGAKGNVERARQEAVTTLTQIAGGEVYLDLLALIREYEQALASGRAQDAEAVLARLGARMEARDIGGEISLTILRAKSAQLSLRSRLESEVKRLDSLAASFRESGASVVQQLWLDAVREVLENPQAEVFAAPSAIGLFSLHMTSSSEIMQARRDSEIARNKAQSAARQAGSFYSPNSEQIMIGRPGRRLKRDASGGDGRF